MAQKYAITRIILGSLLLCAQGPSAASSTPSPTVIATPAQPGWTELSAQQKSVLAPLSGTWDRMENYRRKKWLGIAQRFPAMAPDEQRRVQGQMQEWAKLTPEQIGRAHV